MNRILFVLFLFLSFSHFSAQSYYAKLREKYWEFEENDERALVYINEYIAFAKKENNNAELFRAYEDAIRYSANKKLEYADSAIIAAKLSNNKDLIGDAFIGKGTVYYFNYRKFQPALDEYLKAFEYTKNANDQFLKYQNLYHIGVVKSYLGYYKEGLGLFKQCVLYFEPNTRAKIHPNLIYNNQKGYLNTLHQMIVCYQQLGNYDEANKLIVQGLKDTPKDDEFFVERSYFEKSKAISEYKKNQYEIAISDFDQSILGLKRKNDFTWTSVAYFYQGMSYSKLGKEQDAILNYKKVDSIFNKYQFILPELRQNYEELISYYKKNDNPKEQLYYTNQLLKADSIISTDFKYLSRRVHKEYDIQTLIDAKTDLENTNYLGKYLLAICIVIILVLCFLVFVWFRRKKEVQKRYEELLLRMKTSNQTSKESPIELSAERSSKLDEQLVKRLRKEISDFEKRKGFLEKGITSSKLASQFGTNTAYLSQYINEFEKSNFNTYINKLRIKHVTEKIYTDKKWRNYSVESLAEACGFSNRQSFSNTFYEQNGIRPADFIKKRKEELETDPSS